MNELKKRHLFYLGFLFLVLTGFKDVDWEAPAFPGDEVSHASLHKYDVKFYWIDLEVTDTSTFISGNTRIYIQLLEENIDTLFFELASSMQIDSVELDNETVSCIHEDDFIKIPMIDSYSKNDLLMVRIAYHGLGGSDGFFSGMSNEMDNTYQTHVTWTLSEPFKAKQWFPCKQVLHDKADSAYVFLTVDERLKAGSNGVLTNIADMPGSKKRFEWKTCHPIAYYLLSLAVAEYDEYNSYAKPEGYSDSILIQNYIYAKNDFLTRNKLYIDETKELVEFFSSVFGLYPFANEKYGHCLAPLGGGMEHQTMTTLSNTNFILVAHELAHQWFGDYVTCATWMDIWVNEGFASYAEYIALQGLRDQDQADTWMEEAHNMAMVQNWGSVYVPEEDTDDENRIFNYYLSYKKGASLIHMIRYELANDDLFYDVLQTYICRFADSVATGDDIRQLLEEKSGKGFTDFFNQWYYGAGYPKFTILWKHMNDTLTVVSNQKTSDPSTPLFRMNFDLKLVFENKDTTIRLFQDANVQTYTLYFKEDINAIEFDPDHWLLKEIDSIQDLKDSILDSALISIGPNPFKKNLIIRYNNFNSNGIKITINDLTGKIIYSEFTTGNEVSVNTSGFGSGIYIVVISEGKKKYAKKIVKK